jgi:hypothetical protein
MYTIPFSSLTHLLPLSGDFVPVHSAWPGRSVLADAGKILDSKDIIAGWAIAHLRKLRRFIMVYRHLPKIGLVSRAQVLSFYCYTFQ